MKKALKYLLIIVALLAILTLKTLYHAGVFKSPKDLVNGTLTHVTGAPGCEDITIDQHNGIAFVSSQNRRDFSLNGGIFTLNLNDSSATLKPMVIMGLDKAFKPHGISLYKKHLFVINHGNGHSIEKFLIQGDSLVFIKTYKNDALKSPNDLVAIAENKFYFTNDHSTPLGIRRTLEDFLQIGTGHVVYFDGYTYAKATPNECYLNGINIKGDSLFTASTIGQKLSVYKRDTTSGRLKLLKAKTYGTGLDNIEVADGNNILVGAHTQLLAFLGHAKDPSKLSAAEVLSINTHTLNKKLIYSTVGKPISGISVAATFKNNLLIGAVFDDGLVKIVE